MTREEAISLLSQVNHILVNSNSWLENTHEPLNIAFDMAIKALEQEPCDCVSRKSLLDKLDPLYKEKIKTAPDNMAEGFLQVSNLIKNEPSVTPTHKKGKWINGNPICPCCGEDKFKDLDADIWADWQPKYCPNCGSFMRGEED